MGKERVSVGVPEMPRLGINFAEAVGKIVAKVTLSNDPGSWQALAIDFTDGTYLNFEFNPRLQVKADYNRKLKNGDHKVVKNFGILPEAGGEDHDSAI